jgi:hypothetical protein
MSWYANREWWTAALLLSYARAIKHYRACQSIWILLESCPEYTLVVSLKTQGILFSLVCLFCKGIYVLHQTLMLLYLHPALKLHAGQAGTT